MFTRHESFAICVCVVCVCYSEENKVLIEIYRGNIHFQKKLNYPLQSIRD